MKHEIQMGRGDSLSIFNIDGIQMMEIEMRTGIVHIIPSSGCIVEEPGEDNRFTTISLPQKTRKNQTKLENL